MPKFDPFDPWVLSLEERIYWPATQWRRMRDGHDAPDSWPREYDKYARLGEPARTLSDIIASVGIPRAAWMIESGRLRPVGTRYRWATVRHAGGLDRRHETYGKAATRCGKAEAEGIDLFIVPYDPAQWE